AGSGQKRPRSRGIACGSWRFSFYSRGKLRVQFALGARLGGLAQSIVETREAIMRHGLIGIELDRAEYFARGFVEFAKLVEQRAQFEMRLPERAVLLNGFSQ